MKFNTSLIRLVPRTHLVAGSVSLALVGLGFLWLPANEAEAVRSETTLQLHIEPAGEHGSRLEISAAPRTPPAEQPDTATPDSLPAEVNLPAENSTVQQVLPASWKTVKVNQGDNLSGLFTQVGLGPNELYPLLNALKKQNRSKLLSRLLPGEELAFLIQDGRLDKLHYQQRTGGGLLLEPLDGQIRISNGPAPSPAPQTADVAPPPGEAPLASPEATGVAAADIGASTRSSEAATEALPADSEWARVTVAKGDNLSTLFAQAGLGASQLYPMLNALKAQKQERLFNRLMPGEELAFLASDNKLNKLRYIRNPLESTLIEMQPDGLKITELVREPEVKLLYKQAEITDSLFLAGTAAGLSDTKIMELANIFGWDIDFALDIRQGDRFDLIYEERFLDGNRIGEGAIIAASFINQGQRFDAIRYTDSQGDSNYYTPDGHSMRKAFLRTPVDFARISSRFNPNRKHPIFKTNRPHRGVDYAAPTGTPIKSSGDGKVTLAGRKGGYGKTVIIQHGQKYTTLYAHMSRIKPGMRVGKRVKQGEIIGYVGSTGYATGPHLHYEFRVNGVHRNPLTVKLPQAEPLPKKEMAAFKPLATKMLAQLEMHQQTQLARQ